MTEDELELEAMRRTRDRLATPPFKPVGDWAASRARMVAAYNRAIARGLSESSAVNEGRRPADQRATGATDGSLSARPVREAAT